MTPAAPAAERSASPPPRARLATAPGTGAIAIVVVEADETHLDEVLRRVTGTAPPRLGSVALRTLVEIDEGVVARLAPDRAWLMPHGGPRIVERIRDALRSAGAVWTTPDDVRPETRHPEAADRFEAEALAALADAASPAAIPLLLDQPRRWRAHAASGDAAPSFTGEDRARWTRLDRLIAPPRVCVLGPPNAGKSTLANALAGREVAIASPLAGTTRDAVSSRIDLAGLVVEWLDLPGFSTIHATNDAGNDSGRDSVEPDPIDRAACELAATLLIDADLVVLLAAPGQAWAAIPNGCHAAVLRVSSKADLPVAEASPRPKDAELAISATAGTGLAELVAAARDRLVPPEDLAHPGPWRWTAGR